MRGFPPATGRRWKADGTVQALLLVVAFAGAIYFRSPKLLAEPRLWAEEGPYYYGALQHGGSWISLVVRGNYQLLTNFAAGLALAVPAVWAAYVTTYAAAGVALVNVVLLSRLAREQGWHPAWTILLSVAIALLPAGYELYLTSTNVQWLCSVSVLLLCLARLDDWSLLSRFAALGWTIACGLTGVPSAMLTPIMFAVGLARRSREHLAAAALLALCSLIQLVLIASHPLEGRHFILNPKVLAIAPLLQSVVVPLVGTDLTAQVVDRLRSASSGPVAVLLVGLCVGILAAGAVRLWRASGGKVITAVLFGSAALTSMLNVFGAIGNAGELISTSDGARYFYLSSICWLLLATFLVHRGGAIARVLAASFVIVCVLVGIHETNRDRWRGFVDSGISWRDSVTACHGVRPCRAQAWPVDPMWSFDVFRP